MKVIVQRDAENALWQQLAAEWHGMPVEPPFEFRCHLTAEALVLSARRPSPALLHPEAQEGLFQEFLWKYDTAELFIAPPGGEPYLEFNLAPNGAWWAASFTSPRVRSHALPAVPPGISATGHADASGWHAELRIPLALLRPFGIRPGEAPFRLAVDAILNSPAQLYLTTATDLSGRPNFHRPYAWETALLLPGHDAPHLRPGGQSFPPESALSTTSASIFS